MSLAGLLFVTLICLFLISRKSQRVMHDLLEILTNPERVKLQSAVRVLDALFKDEINKMNDNFIAATRTLNSQIEHTEQIKQDLTVRTDRLNEIADDATRKIANMSQCLENTVIDLQNTISSTGWTEVQHTTETFTAHIDELLNKIQNATTSSAENSNKIQEQITKCIESEQQMSSFGLFNTTRNANINRDNSPPDAILCNGANGVPGFVFIINTIESVPFIDGCDF